MNVVLIQKETLLRRIGVAVLWVSIMLSAALLWLWRDAVSLITDAFLTRTAYSAESTEGDSAARLLASIEHKTPTPTDRQIGLFALMLDNLHTGCVLEDREDVARALLSAHKASKMRGKTLSLKTAANIVQGLLPKTPLGSGSCIEVARALETYESF